MVALKWKKLSFQKKKLMANLQYRTDVTVYNQKELISIALFGLSLEAKWRFSMRALCICDAYQTNKNYFLEAWRRKRERKVFQAEIVFVSFLTFIISLW